MRELLWRVAAFVISRRPIARAIIRRAKRTPYFHLDGYMNRWWVFNGYSEDAALREAGREKSKRWPRLPSIRVHHILRADDSGHPHDHPWNARTIILDGWYLEQRVGEPDRMMRRGSTGPILFEKFHHIEQVSEGGVYTLFITGAYGGGWGFLVDGTKVPWREYLARYGAAQRTVAQQRKGEGAAHAARG